MTSSAKFLKLTSAKRYVYPGKITLILNEYGFGKQQSSEQSSMQIFSKYIYKRSPIFFKFLEINSFCIFPPILLNITIFVIISESNSDCFLVGWLESVGSRVVYELDYKKPVLYVNFIQSILGKLPLVPVGDTGTVPHRMRNTFPGAPGDRRPGAAMAISFIAPFVIPL